MKNIPSVRLEVRANYSGKHTVYHGSVFWFIMTGYEDNVADITITASCLCAGEHCVRDWLFEDLDITELPYVVDTVCNGTMASTVAANLIQQCTAAGNELADAVLDHFNDIDGNCISHIADISAKLIGSH